MLEHATIIALLVLAVWYVMQDGEIFAKLGDFFYKHTPKKIHPALFECPICMTAWYGSALYILIYGVNIQWPIVVICAMGINVVVNKLSPDKEAPNLTDKVEEIESRLDANGIFK